MSIAIVCVDLHGLHSSRHSKSVETKLSNHRRPNLSPPESHTMKEAVIGWLKQTLRVQRTQTWGIYGFYARNSNDGFG